MQNLSASSEKLPEHLTLEDLPTNYLSHLQPDITDQRYQRDSLLNNYGNNQSYTSDEDPDIALYNEVYLAFRGFKLNFDQQQAQFKLAWHNAVTDLLKRLPSDVKSMRADAFLLKSSEDSAFDRDYNLSFRVVENSALGLLEPVQRLLEVHSALSLMKHRDPLSRQEFAENVDAFDAFDDYNPSNPVIHNPFVNDQVINDYVPNAILENKRHLEDKEIQCRFSQRFSNSIGNFGINEVGSGSEVGVKRVETVDRETQAEMERRSKEKEKRADVVMVEEGVQAVQVDEEQKES